MTLAPQTVSRQLRSLNYNCGPAAAIRCTKGYQSVSVEVVTGLDATERKIGDRVYAALTSLGYEVTRNDEFPQIMTVTGG